MIRNSYTLKTRALALLLVLAAVLVMLPAFSVTAAADNENTSPTDIDSSTGIIHGYEWHRVMTKKDLPPKGTRCPVLILWKENNNICYATGGYAGNKVLGPAAYEAPWDYVKSGYWNSGTTGMPDPFVGDYKDTSSFLTTSILTTWEMSVTGKEDGDNKKAAQVRFYPNSSSLLTGYDDFDFPNKTTDSNDLWTLYTKDLGGKYGNNLNDGEMRIFANVKYDDTGFMHWNGCLYGYCSSTYDYDKFVMYWGEERNLSAITDDYYIPSGQTLNIDDGVMLMPGVKIVVEPGGVLSVEGTFYNDGSIENYGTVVLQKDSCICCSTQATAESGSLLCCGGTVSLKDFYESRVLSLTYMKGELTKRIKFDLEPAHVSMQGAVGMMKDRAAEAQAEIDKLYYLKEELDMLEADYADKKAVEKDVTELGKEIDEKRKNYKDKVEPFQREVDEYNSYYSEEQRTLKELNEAQDALNAVTEELKVIYVEGHKTAAAEGNLVMLENSKLILGKGKNASFLIEKDANVTCNGYIIAPHVVTLDAAKLKICRDGVLFTGYRFPNSVTNPANAEVKSAHTINVSIAGLEVFKDAEKTTADTTGVQISGDYFVFEVNGVHRSSYEFPSVWEDCEMDPNYGTGMADKYGGEVWSGSGKENYWG